jgi:hypothetical protein
MSAEDKNSGPETVTKQSRGRYSVKSPGRVAFMKRLNEEGLGGMGGRRPTHGVRALAERLKRGLNPDTPLAAFHAELRGKYLADLGGEGNLSNMEAGICDRLADLDLMRGLLNAQRETAKRMTAAALLNHVQGVTRNVLAYVQAVKAIGPGRRQVEADRTVVVRRYAADPAASAPPQPDNGQEGQAGADRGRPVSPQSEDG